MSFGPYDVGDGLVATVAFDVAGVATDPTTVTAEVREPDATVTTYTYSAEEGQTAPFITRTGVGAYRLELVPDAAGEWVVRWTGTGAVTAVVEQTYTVSPSAIDGALIGSYTADPANRPVDAVRLYVGDTTSPFDFSDREIEWFLVRAGDDALGAAVIGAGAIAARFSRLVDSSVGDIRKSYSQRYKHFAEVAERLTDDVAASGAPMPWAGGISYDERDAADADLIPAFFYEGMDDRPGAGDRAGYCR